MGGLVPSMSDVSANPFRGDYGMCSLICNMVDLLLITLVIPTLGCSHEECIKTVEIDELNLGCCGGRDATFPGTFPVSLTPPIIFSMITLIQDGKY